MATAASDSLRSSARVLAVQKSKETRELAESMNKGASRLDHSVVRPSIDVSVTGMKQALLAAENGTAEIRQYLFHECNVIYECKVCLCLFRSLANLVAHKRSFCQLRHSQTRHKDVRECQDLPATASENANGDAAITTTATVYVVPEEPLDTMPKPDAFDLDDYSPSIEVMREAGIISEIENRALFSQLRGQQRPRTIEGVAKRLKGKVDASFDSGYYAAKELRLEKMRQNPNAVFQTLRGQLSSLPSFTMPPSSTTSSSMSAADFPSMGEKYVAWQNEKQLSSGFLGPGGRLLSPGSAPCDTLSDSSKENNVTREQVVQKYPCPLCSKRSYTSIFGLKRHLKTGHAKSAPEANDLSQGVRKRSYLAEVDGEGNIVSTKKQLQGSGNEGSRKRSQPPILCRKAGGGDKGRKALGSGQPLNTQFLHCKDGSESKGQNTLKGMFWPGGGRGRCFVKLERLSEAKIAGWRGGQRMSPAIGRRALAKLQTTPTKKGDQGVPTSPFGKEPRVTLAPVAFSQVPNGISFKREAPEDIDNDAGGQQPLAKKEKILRQRTLHEMTAVLGDFKQPAERINGSMTSTPESQDSDVDECGPEVMRRLDVSVRLQRLKDGDGGQRDRARRVSSMNSKANLPPPSSQNSDVQPWDANNPKECRKRSK